MYGEIGENYTFDDLMSDINEINEWERTQMVGTYSSFGGVVGDKYVDMGHVSVSRGISSFETKDRWHNKIRNDFLDNFPIFGEKHMIYANVLQATDNGVEKIFQSYLNDSALIETYIDILGQNAVKDHCYEWQREQLEKALK